ncbi:MAG: MFS transporter [Chromatiales bacterium]|nr:MAG: MFS transporter [Chromatiales bacterium]
MVNVLILAIAQFFSAIGQVTLVVLAGLIGTVLAPDPRFATVPVTCGVLGVAAASVPAALAMKRFGRQRVFITGSVLAAIGALIAAVAVQNDNFWWYCIANLLIGANFAFAAQFRFAAAESVEPTLASRVIAWVMLGTIGAAAIGPRLVVAVRGWTDTEYVASFLLLAAVFLMSAATLTRFRNPVIFDHTTGDGARPLGTIARQPVFLVAVLGAAVGFGIMALIMTATPLSMHFIDGHTVEQTAWVIQGHSLAMYIPSLFSGWLVARWGAYRMLALGALLEAGCVAFALAGREVMHYAWALIALGVGWNLMYVASTTLLIRAYRPAERFRVQALNDFSMFGVMAVASLLAGVLINTSGWAVMNAVALVPLILVLVGTTLMGRRTAPETPAATG